MVPSSSPFSTRKHKALRPIDNDVLPGSTLGNDQSGVPVTQTKRHQGCADSLNDDDNGNDSCGNNVVDLTVDHVVPGNAAFVPGNSQNGAGVPVTQRTNRHPGCGNSNDDDDDSCGNNSVLVVDLTVDDTDNDIG
mmetsp:Transcript_30840/g.64388  ORF Transcript_30840/g.64388 Transcript_30840/m.64388 type:complete len:135 (+) Transcript_30840:451-855(+)